MNVYVESNFVLELTLSQEQYNSCERLLSLCEAGTHTLVLPAFSIPESFSALLAKGKTRTRLIADFQAERGQLARSD
ncbi:MAG TPA: hypothetical protein VMT64_06905, partial [Candidatus Binataceae bacterium]|nr:hypothetical protein [Candidatus Binataceae bacterium]